MEHDHSNHQPERKDYWGLRYSLGVAATLGILGFFLLTEHRAHLYGALPYLLILACPLMHLFMHGGHGGHGGHGSDQINEYDNTHSHRSSSAGKASNTEKKGDW